MVRLNKYFKFSLFLLILLSAFNGLNLFGIEDSIDISLVLTILLALDKGSKFELSIFIAILLLLQIFGDSVTLYDSFVKISLIFIAIYLNKFFIWNSERNEILFSRILINYILFIKFMLIIDFRRFNPILDTYISFHKISFFPLLF